MKKAKRWFYVLLLVCFTLTTMGFKFELPPVKVPESSVLYDNSGRAIKGLSEQNRVSVPLEEISPYFLQAVVAVEDKNFYQHHGIDFTGLIRATLSNLRNKKIVAGGSTITQQTAKNLFLGNERTLSRKIKEFYYALQLERKYSKDEILNMYSNTIYFGEGAYGVEVASRTYFSRGANELTIAQAALLAGIPQWPSHFNPYQYPDNAKARQEIVLQRMMDEGVISEAQRKKASEENLEYQKSQYVSSVAPYFTAMVRDYLVEKYGDRLVYQGGLRVYTTLDLDMQLAANQAYQDGMANRDKDLQVALVALDVKTKQIRALVGGRDFNASNYNRVYSSRQPGSTFKSFVYSLAIDQGYVAASMMMCEEMEYPLPDGSVYKPTDYGDEPYHWRDFTLKEAIMKSDNVVAVRLTEEIGVEQASQRAEAFGFSGIQPVLSLALGSNEVRPIDLATAYCVFADQGLYNLPSYILKVTDRNGVILEEGKTQAQKRVLSEETSYIITDMLTGVLEAEGTAPHLKEIVGRRAAGKTGTTDEYKDAWFVGYTPQLCCAVWVGYDRNKAVNLAGGVVAGPIWANFMNKASQKLPQEDFVKPSGIQSLSVCLDTGLVAWEECPRQIEMAFINGTEPQELCYEHSPISDRKVQTKKKKKQDE